MDPSTKGDRRRREELDERLRDLVNGEFAPLGFERERDYFFPRRP